MRAGALQRRLLPSRRVRPRRRSAQHAVPSNTILGGEFALRVAITNHRTRMSDIDLLVDEAERMGDELLAELQPVTAGGEA